MLAYLKFFIYFIIFVGFINCAKIKLGSEIEHGNWTSKHRISFPFTIEGQHYFYGLSNQNDGRFWFIQNLQEDGKMSIETDYGDWNRKYTQTFPFVINDKQFVYGIDDEKYWSTREILPGGKMGSETANGVWKSKPTLIFPFYIGGKHYVYTLSDTDWFIKELLPKEEIGLETDHGTWKHSYTIGFPFSINGRQYFYSVSDKYWIIQELLSGGKMGTETDHGNWQTNHVLSVPFSIDNKYYFYGLHGWYAWFIQELLPGGKMGPEKLFAKWNLHYNVMFPFYINGRQFLYGISEYQWFIQEIIQDPRLPIIATNTTKKCCNICQRGWEWEVLNAVEEHIADIEKDKDNYHTKIFCKPDNPVKSISTFSVFAEDINNNHINLIAAMRAEIYYNHMASIGDTTISIEVIQHLREMDGESDDEAGRLLASSLGGSSLPINFAPQSPMLNLEVNVIGSEELQPGWNDVVEMLRDFLLERIGYLRWSLLPEYALLPNSRRPTAFALSIRFYDHQHNLLNWRGKGAVRSYNFLNVPINACIGLNNPWRNNF